MEVPPVLEETRNTGYPFERRSRIEDIVAELTAPPALPHHLVEIGIGHVPVQATGEEPFANAPEAERVGAERHDTPDVAVDVRPVGVGEGVAGGEAAEVGGEGAVAVGEGEGEGVELAGGVGVALGEGDGGARGVRLAEGGVGVAVDERARGVGDGADAAEAVVGVVMGSRRACEGEVLVEEGGDVDGVYGIVDAGLDEGLAAVGVVGVEGLDSARTRARGRSRPLRREASSDCGPR